jgi:hypothetical protein
MRAGLGTTGNVLSSTLWVCNDDTIRHVRCRPFYRGPDAAAAIDGLHRVPRRDDDWAEFWAWELNDLSVALGWARLPSRSRLGLIATSTYSASTAPPPGPVSKRVPQARAGQRSAAGTWVTKARSTTCPVGHLGSMGSEQYDPTGAYFIAGMRILLLLGASKCNPRTRSSS